MYTQSRPDSDMADSRDCSQFHEGACCRREEGECRAMIKGARGVRSLAAALQGSLLAGIMHRLKLLLHQHPNRTDIYATPLRKDRCI